MSDILEVAPRYDIAQFETGGKPVRFANGAPQLRRDGTIKHAARAYRTTDPATIMHKLTDAGFTVCRAQSLFSHTVSDKGGKSPWRFGIEARYPVDTRTIQNGLNTGYVDRVRILLAHNGRQALRIAPGALRCACTNQFTSAVISIRHTDPEIDHFNEDPAGVLFGMRELCGDTVRRVEALRGRPAPPSYILTIHQQFPRVSRVLQTELPRYHQQDPGAEYSLWSLVQALTATRSPRAIQGAAMLVRWHGEGFDGAPDPKFLKLFAKN